MMADRGLDVRAPIRAEDRGYIDKDEVLRMGPSSNLHFKALRMLNPPIHHSPHTDPFMLPTLTRRHHAGDEGAG